MPTRVVCISRALGAHGEDVGRLVAERLGFRYVDEEIVALAAERGRVDPATISDSEQRRSFVHRLLEQLATSGGPEAIFPVGAVTDLTDRTEVHRALIRDVVEEVGGQGDAVIVAHAASIALGGRADVLRVFVTASPETRTGRVAEAQELEPKAASKRVRDEDAARASYFREFYDLDRELPTHYDLVINTDAVTAEQAADIVVHAAQLAR
jgi:hypothetical protein